MAEKVIVHLIDDITGHHGEDVELVQFSVDGVDYEIDLCADNADKLRDAFAGYIRVARKTTAKRQSTGGSSGNTSGDDKAKAADRKALIKAIREWAQGKFELSERGRIPLAVEQAYNKAMDNGTEQPPTADTVVEAEIVGDETGSWQQNGIPVPAFSG